MTDQSDISDETLMALADGALPELERVRTEAAIKASVDLNARYQVFVRTRDALKNEFAARELNPETDKLRDLVGQIKKSAATNVLPFEDRKTRRVSPLSFRNITAIAATLVIGVMIGVYADQFQTTPVGKGHDKRMVLSFSGDKAEMALTSRGSTLMETLRQIGKAPGTEIFNELQAKLSENGIAQLPFDDDQILLIRSLSDSDCIEISLQRGEAIIDQTRLCRAADGTISANEE